MKEATKTIFYTLAFLFFSLTTFGQDSLYLSLEDAVKTGIDSSKQLMLAETKIQNTINQLEKAKDQQLPDAKASFMGSEAFIPTHTIQIEGLMEKPIELPKNSTMYIGTLSINELIFAGNKLQYAKSSAKILEKVARLKKAHHREGVVLSVIQAYINIFKIDQNIKITNKNIHDIEERLKETKQFKEEGLATLNDVLRFKLQKSQARLTLVDLQNNRAVANYALVVMLGLPENTVLKIDDPTQTKQKGVQNPNQEKTLPLQYFIRQAIQEREDLKTYALQKGINKNKIKSIKADKLPVLGAGINTYYINPNQQFFPPKHSFLAPVTVGLNLSWNISSLYTSKHKVQEAQIEKQQIDLAKKAETDQVKIAVNKSYHAYLKAIQRIKELQTTVAQSKENNRIMELKYKNQLVTTTDRIDAETLYFKSLINLAVAKAEATEAWYELQASSGTLKNKF